MEGSGFQRTDDECHNCEEDVMYVKGSQRVCGSCGYAPDYEQHSYHQTAVERYRQAVEYYAQDEIEGRPKLVGGFESAYYGDGEGSYEFCSDGFTI
jgi:ribosomal protein S27AE